MDILAFVAIIIDSIAWPSAIVVGLWLIRKHLFEFISSSTFSIKYKEWTFNVTKAMDELKDRQDKLENKQDEIHEMIKNINRTEPKKQDS